MLLGASEWGKWESIEFEMEQMRTIENRALSCYSMKSKSFGSFAVLYSRNAAQKVR